jgi:hypothetical protein
MEKLAAQPAGGARQIVPASEPMGTMKLARTKSSKGSTNRKALTLLRRSAAASCLVSSF